MSKKNIGVIEFNNSGNATIKIDNKNYFIWEGNINNALPNDNVEVEIFSRNNRTEATVIKVIERFRTKFVFNVLNYGKKGSLLKFNDNRIKKTIRIKDNLSDNIGDNVLLELVETENIKNLHFNLLEVIGKKGNNEVEINTIMLEYGLPMDFPLIVEAEAEMINESISQTEIDKRLDLRNILTIGIDPFDSKDADDTLSLEKINNVYNIYINIADVTFYVRENTELDKEAFLRGNSVYLVDRVVPMLPKRLSNNICSLKSGSDKLAYSVKISFNENFDIIDRWFGRTIINVDKDYSYEMAQEIIENGSNDSLSDMVLTLDKIAKKLRNERSDDNLEFNNKEVKFILDEETKKPTGVYLKVQKDSNKLIEEFMLLANKEVATFIKSKGLPCVNRIHEAPDDLKVLELKNFISSMGYKLDLKDDIKKEFNELIKEINGTPEENMITTLITRTQKKAVYSTKNIGHFGLGFKDYCHKTSPIRRYSDILIHRLLTLALGNDGYPNK